MIYIIDLLKFFLTEYFSPYGGTSDDLEVIPIYQELVLFVEFFLIFVVAIAAFAVILAIIVFPMAVLEPPILLSERNKLIQQALWKIGEFPIFVESPAGVVSIKLIDIPGDLHLEVPTKNKVISIPLETEFGTIIRNIRIPEKEIGEDFFNFLNNNVDPKSRNAVISMEYEGEELRIIIPKDLLENTQMLMDKFKKK